MALTPLLHTIRSALRPALASAGAIELCEDDPGSTIPSFQLKTTHPALVLRFDRVPHPAMSVNDRLFPLLNQQTPGLSACCDYVILWQMKAPADAPLYVLLAELKSGGAAGARVQIENARMLVDHLLEVVRQRCGARIPPESVRYRGLVFTPRARPQSGDPRRHPCRYEPSPGMPDVLLVRHPPCDGYSLDWFCADTGKGGA